MSRFDQGRWSRVVVWTGAALAWGSALVAARLEPGREVPANSPPSSVQVDTEGLAAFPVPPEQGILVLRPPGTAPAPAPNLAPTPAPAPQSGPAPDPVSQGS
jgi:hypothetical protein